MKYRQEALVMNDYIAYCGLDCEACEARLATVNNDAERFSAHEYNDATQRVRERLKSVW